MQLHPSLFWDSAQKPTGRDGFTQKSEGDEQIVFLWLQWYDDMPVFRCFLHGVTTNEEEVDHFRKLWPFMEHLKSHCFMHYQLRQHLSIYEHMVKSCSTHGTTMCVTNSEMGG